MDHHLPSGYCKTLNEQQEIELNKLADKVKDVSYVMNHPSGEAFLLRFLRATMDKKKTDRIFHTENTGKRQRAYERLMKAVEFHEKWDLDNPPAKYAEFDRLRPYKLWMDEKAMRPVLCEKAGQIYSCMHPSDFTMDEWTACIGYRIAEVERRVEEFREKHGLDDRPLLVAIQDSGGLSLSVRRMRPIINLYNRILGEHHPEILEHVYIINAPWIFEAFFHVIKSVIDPFTLEKVQVLPKAHKLAEMFDLEQLPEEYGGKGENAPPPPRVKDDVNEELKEEEMTEEELNRVFAEENI